MTTRHVPIASPVFEMLSDKIVASYPNACILFIDEVDNPDLLRPFEARRESIHAMRGENPAERLLFHGTHASSIDSIALKGFDPSMNRVSAYGRGTYFAASASYAFSYMKSSDIDGVSYMIAARVLIGVATRAGMNQKIDTTRYDNSVDIPDPHKASIVVSPYPDGAYPAYIIGFHASAST